MNEQKIREVAEVKVKQLVEYGQSPYVDTLNVAKQILSLSGEIDEAGLCRKCFGSGNLTFNTTEGWHDTCPLCKGSGTGTIKGKWRLKIVEE
jgi:DnaJ-class molecular chaperone